MSAVHWLQHTTPGLLLLAALAIALLLVLIIKFRLEPWITLIVVSILVALASGIPVAKLVGNLQSPASSLLEKGFGGILGHIAVIIGLGTLLGALLESSGGAQVLTKALLRGFGEKRASLAMGISGLIFGIPVFFDIGIFVLAPLVYAAARQGKRSLLIYALPLIGGLSMTHAFLPPHPGPVAAAGLLGVNLGWLIIMGLACGIPAWFASSVLFAGWVGRRVNIAIPEEMAESLQAGKKDDDDTEEPPLSLVLWLIAVPLVLILFGTFGSIWLPKNSGIASAANFFGTPAVALTIAVLLALWLLGFRRGMSKDRIGELSSAALRPVAMILLVVGAGAFFGAVLSATGIGKAVADSLDTAGLPLLLAAYVISCGLRLAQGSATVAITTTTGILAPTIMELHYSQPKLALVAMAISSGSIIASHVNDGGFWIVSRYFGMSVKDTLRTWTVLETVLSVVGFGMAALINAFV